ncbi:MAG: hypothetical protein U0324_16995 [Polyangiales bacterium]
MNVLRPLAALALTAVFARAATGCSNSTEPPDLASAPDAGPDVSASCGISSQCEAHNQLCARAPGSVDGRCAPPADNGLCTPTGSTIEGMVANCYPGATCVPVPSTLSARGGMCSFAGAPGEVFRVPGAPKIALIDPTPFNEYQPTQALTLRWTPPAGTTADTTTVAVLFKRLPQRDANSNRLSNAADIVWIWSSTEPGGAAPGAVSLRAGRRGLRADGSLGPGFDADTLPAGRYWWMTYTLREGAVRAASDTFTFRVGGDVAEQMCNDVSQCTALIPGETADRVACVYGRCLRRCASDLDCPGARRRCATDVTLAPPPNRAAERLPSGAYCVTQ